MMRDILCVGLNPAIDVYSIADKVEPTHKVRSRNAKYDPGGGAINVARVIAVLGGHPGLAYLSGGVTGLLFDALLDNHGIEKERFEIAGSVRISYVVKETRTGLEYRFVPEGPEVQSTEIQPLMNYLEKFGGKYLVASGSLPRGLPSSSYVQMADIAKKTGTRFVLDSSGEALREAFDSGGIYLAKPSRHEMEVFVGHELDVKSLGEAALELLSKGTVQNLVISLGADGALLANSGGIVQVPSILVETQSAVGAGDSFVGAMIWHLSQGNTIDAAFRYGVAAGCAAVLTTGTELCRRADVDAFFKKIQSI